MGQKPGELASTSRQGADTGAMDGLDGSASPEAIRAQIAQTRAEMAETLDALQEKLDPDYLKDRAAAQLHAATIGTIEPRLERAQHRVQETVTAMRASTASLVEAANARTQRIAAQARERAEGGIQAAATRVRGAGDPASAQGAQRLPSGTAMQTDAGGWRGLDMVMLLQRLQPPARALAGSIRAYPVTACMLTLGIGLALGQALMRRHASAENHDAMPVEALPPPAASIAAMHDPRTRYLE